MLLDDYLPFFILVVNWKIYVVRTAVTQDYFKSYKSKLPENYDVVANGGWDELEKLATAELATANFAKSREFIPSSYSPVPIGGWKTLEGLAADPKGELVKLIVAGLKNSESTDYKESGKIDALVALLESQGKGFDSELVDGEWLSVLNRQAQKSPKFQKLVGKGEKVGNTFSNFDIEGMTFNGNVKLLFGKGDLQSTVKVSFIFRYRFYCIAPAVIPLVKEMVSY